MFQHPFGRIQVGTKAYLLHLVRYVHFNPQKHGLVADFREWPYYSYHSLTSREPTRLQREAVLGWFNGVDGFLAVHRIQPDEGKLALLTPDDFD